ncbi:batten's disease protein Cln3 [Mycena alexandri]|uniref:Protein BTN n=1 Tax=Mycena alexandri TaxID=1745969 RepID=A0AAD6X0S3_9AGAR|nr:batten's disease protein Cln3 [Mycena alexandri]
MVAPVSSSPHPDTYEMRPSNVGVVSEHSLLRDPSDDEFLDRNADAVAKGQRKLILKLGASFFLFGLINNVLYVIILSAALDLVPPSTPKGIIAFCNIAPALVAKIGWPYILKGRIRYAKRLIGCCLLSAFGMLVVAFFDSLSMRLLGIGLASFSSGLGELTFLQLSTTYAPPSVAGHSVGYFASGTGAAGLVGAFLWWEVRGLGVRVGVGLSSVMPFIIPLTAQYYFLLPRPPAFLASSGAYENASAATNVPYAPLATADEDFVGEEEDSLAPGHKHNVSLSAADKWRLVRPMLVRYMLPLFCVYLFEYTINQGIAPTLLYPVPSSDAHPFLSKIIHSIRDYYPLWQLVYQTTVFFSRSSISLGVPPLPARLLPLPAVLQAGILLLLAFESAVGIFPSGQGADDTEAWSIATVFLLISLEGICGGSAYVNVFYRINQDPPSPETAHDIERTRQEREFKIGSVGFADSSGILFASILAVPTEVALCRQQVARGKLLCKGL